jgi:glycosyltransferase involved in cell wall biosynthesis/2-polyprenyl-3-methyl-5-hydroxy-6-metoxy-1,4-benzoquinol methylase
MTLPTGPLNAATLSTIVASPPSASGMSSMTKVTKAKRLEWTRILAERYWQGTHDASLHAAHDLQAIARHLVFAMAVHIPATEKVTLFLERNGDLDDVLRFAGYSVERIDAGPRNRDEVNAPLSVAAGGGSHSVILVPDALAQLTDDEVDAFFSVIRASLRARGRLVLTVPNNEILDQGLAIDPLNGAMFHIRQRTRSFTPETLRTLLIEHGFEVHVLQQLELSDRGFARRDDIAKALSSDPDVHVGNGGTLFAIASQRGPAPEKVPEFEALWLEGFKAARFESTQRRPPTPLLWTTDLIDDFWSYVAATPLDDLSFGRVNGAAFIQVVSLFLRKDWRYLDFGAGDGFLAELMLRDGFSIAALEPAQERRKALNRRLTGFPGYLGSIEHAQNLTSFDCVIATEVIEHVSDDQLPSVLDTIWRALVPGGTLLLTTPNQERLEHSALYSPISGAVFHRWQHLQSWTADRLSTALETRGFRVEGVHSVSFSAVASQASPFAEELLLAKNARAPIAEGETLLCIARRPGVDSANNTQEETVSECRMFRAPAATAREAHALRLPLTAESAIGKSASTKAINGSAAIRRLRRITEAVASGPIRSFGRRVLPTLIKQRLANVVRWAEDLDSQFAEFSLLEFEPLCPPGAFSAGGIVLVNNALAWGGVERQVVTLLHALDKRGEPSGLLCLRLGETEDHDFYLPKLDGYQGFLRNACAVKEAKAALTNLFAERQEQISALIRWMPSDVRDEILRFVAEFLILKPRALHAWQDSTSIVAGYAARIAGVPRIVLSSRNVNPTNFSYYRPYMHSAYRELARCADIRMVNNSEAGSIDYASWLNVDRQRFGIHRNGIDVSLFKRAEPERVAALRNSLGIPDSAPVVGSLFRFYAEKDPNLWVDMARRVAAEHPDVHFVIFGVGPLKNKIETTIRKYGLAERMHLPGTIDEPNLAYGLFDVFVLTSHYEGTPNVVIEACALGVPVVTTEAGGTAEAIKCGETGLVGNRDAGELAKLVLSVLADRSWPSRASVQGPAFIKERFGLDRMVDEALAFYSLLGRNQPPI